MERYGNSRTFWTAEDKAKRDLEIEILKADRCTECEAIKHLENGTIVYESIDEYIDSLKETVRDEEAFIEEYGSEEEIINCLKKNKMHLDNPLVKYDEKEYVVVYCL